MPIKAAGQLSAQTGIVAATPAADRTTQLQPDTGLAVVVALTTGPATTGAKLQVTNSAPDLVAAGGGEWVDSGNAGAAGFVVASSSGEGCQLTGVRLVVTDGTWSMQVSQF